MLIFISIKGVLWLWPQLKFLKNEFEPCIMEEGCSKQLYYLATGMRCRGLYNYYYCYDFMKIYRAQVMQLNTLLNMCKLSEADTCAKCQNSATPPMIQSNTAVYG